MIRRTTNNLVKISLVATIYVILTIILAPISYGPVQFRLSEVLVLFAYIHPMYIFALTLGCLISNLFSGYGLLDLFFGTAATFFSVFAIGLIAKYFKDRKFSLLIASLFPTIFNGIIVGWLISTVTYTPLLMNVLQVGFGEFVVVTILGIPFYKIIESRFKVLVK